MFAECNFSETDKQKEIKRFVLFQTFKIHNIWDNPYVEEAETTE